MGLEAWKEGLAEVCEGFQLDLSSLVDGEIDETAAAGALLHLESCSSCRAFFDDVRRMVQVHGDLEDPDRLMARIAMLTGAAGFTFRLPEGQDLVHRLATIFYQLGKAYVLTAIDPGFRERVFERAVPVDPARARGRGLIDGAVSSGNGRDGLDLHRARGLLNGKLERIRSPLEKGRRLLQEALEVEPGHEEARLYTAFLHAREGRPLQAAKEYRRVFDTAVEDANRGHAAIQLGRLHSQEGDYRKAVAWFRWVTMSGLAEADDRFWVARFNLGMVLALDGNRRRSLEYFRALLDRHPGRAGEVACSIENSPGLREAIDRQKGFAEELRGTCPELFAAGAGPAGSRNEEA